MQLSVVARDVKEFMRQSNVPLNGASVYNVHFFQSNKFYTSRYVSGEVNSVADLGFPDEANPRSERTNLLFGNKFCQKLHKINKLD